MEDARRSFGVANKDYVNNSPIDKKQFMEKKKNSVDLRMSVHGKVISESILQASKDEQEYF